MTTASKNQKKQRHIVISAILFTVAAVIFGILYHRLPIERKAEA